MGSSTIFTSTASDPSSVSTTTSPSNNHLLEITLISAQDLAPISKSAKTFAVVWVHPCRKLSTSVEKCRNSEPSWNEKFVFRVSDDFLDSDESAVFIEIFTISWFRNNLIGTVRVMVNDLIPSSSRTDEGMNSCTRFVALQVRRPSGSPQGILNMAVSLTDIADPCVLGDASSDHVSEKVIKSDHREIPEHDVEKRLRVNIHSWPSDNEKLELNCNGSMVNESSVVMNGSDVCSDVGPSASVVAAAIAQGKHAPRTPAAKEIPILKRDQGEVDAGGSILGDLTMEEAKAKGYRMKAERPPAELPLPPPSPSKSSEKRQSGWYSDSFSCFVYGLEFTVVCSARHNDW